MNIAIDIDDSMAKFVEAFLPFYNATTGKNLAKKDIHSSDLRLYWGMPKDSAAGVIDTFVRAGGLDTLALYPDVRETLERLSKQHTLFIITGRKIAWRQSTERWIRQHLAGIPFKVLFAGDFYTTQGKTKAQLCVEQGIHTIIEDDATFAKACAEAGIRVLLVDQPWNESLRSEKITRVREWKEIEQILKGSSPLF